MPECRRPIDPENWVNRFCTVAAKRIASRIQNHTVLNSIPVRGSHLFKPVLTSIHILVLYDNPGVDEIRLIPVPECRRPIGPENWVNWFCTMAAKWIASRI